jgi:hypothetical protein
LFTNVTVVDDAIRFVASHTAARKTIEKANSDDRPTLDEQTVTLKDLRKIVATSRAANNNNNKNKQHYFLAEYQANHFGYGILKNTKWQIS